MAVYQTVSGVTSEVTSGFTVEGIGDDDGTVTFLTAPLAGVEITILREVPLLQETDYSAQGKVSPEQVEDDLDLQQMQVQDLSERQDRSYSAPVTGKDFISGNVPKFNDDGNLVDTGVSSATILAAQGFSEDAANSAASAALSVAFAIEAYDTPAAAITATLSHGRKVISVNTDYDVAPTLPDRGSVVFQGSGSFPGTNQDGPTYRRQVIPELAQSARAVADLDLSAFTDLARETSLKIVVTGDSLTTWQVNDIAPPDSFTEELEKCFADANPNIQINIVGRGIGSQKWDNLNAQPDPAISAIYPWYTDTAAPWLDYIESELPDIVVISLGMNDRQNFNRGSFEGVMTKLANFAKPPHVILCTPMVPTLSPHANFAIFGDYADQEGRDWNAGYVRSWAKFYGIPLLDINRTFNMVRDGRDILDSYFTGLPDVAISPPNNWQADAEDACRDWSAVVNVKASAWTSAETFYFSMSSGAGNVCHVRDNGAGELELKLYRGSSLIFSTVSTGIATPTVDQLVEISLSGNDLSIRLYVDKWATDPVKVPVIRFGGLYRPTIGYSTGASGAVASVQFSPGTERAYMPTGTDLDIWGVQNATAAIDPVTGGGGPNHPTSLGSSLIYDAHFREQDFSIPIPETDSVEFRSVALASAVDVDYDFGDSVVDTVTVKFLTTAEGAGVGTISDGNFVGQFADWLNAFGSTWSVTLRSTAIEGNAIVIPPGSGVLTVWDGFSWVRRTDALSQGAIAAAVAAALVGYTQVAAYSDSFTPVFSFSTGGSFGGTYLAHYEVISGVLHWWIRYTGAVTLPASTGSFLVDLSDTGATPDTFKSSGHVGYITGVSKTPRSGELCMGLVVTPATGAAVRIQKMYPTVANQNLLSTDFATTIEINVSGSFVVT
tara:strand:- start:33497 stop:36172 length:2676 start_codon:yes stop_codon:yes gene_type:complete